VTDENRLVDLQMIEQPDKIGRQVFDVVVLDLLRSIGRTIATLIRRDDTDSRFAQRLDLVTP
jgi:hypothetical protein